MKIHQPVLSACAFLLTVLIAGTVFAFPTMSSYTDFEFYKNSTSTPLQEITIIDDTSTPMITAANGIRITIPSTAAMLFDEDRIINEVYAYGIAVDNGKISAKPIITFEDKDRTVFIPVLKDFTAGESVIIRNLAVKGFNSTTNESNYLSLVYDKTKESVKDTKHFSILISSNSDKNIPTKPKNIQIIQISDTSVKLTWTDPTDLDLQFVDILRGLNEAPISGTPYQQIQPGKQEFIDDGLKEGDTVKYILRAEDGPNLGDITDTYTYTMVKYVPPTEVETGTETSTETDTETSTETGTETSTETGAETSTSTGTESSEGTGTETSTENTTPVFTDLVNVVSAPKIETMVEKGIIKGKETDKFDPEGSLNRAEAAALLYRIVAGVGDEPVTPDKTSFSDVGKTEWYAGYVKYLKDLNLLNGKTKDLFSPTAEITRAEFVVMAIKAFEYVQGDNMVEGGLTGPIEYADEMPTWAKDAVDEAINLGFLEVKRNLLQRGMTLYMGEGCPHCDIVEQYIHEKSYKDPLKITEKEIFNNPKNLDELNALANKLGLGEVGVGVPFLVYGNIYAMGDAKVIEYLDKMYGEANKVYFDANKPTTRAEATEILYSIFYET